MSKFDVNALAEFGQKVWWSEIYEFEENIDLWFGKSNKIMTTYIYSIEESSSRFAKLVGDAFTG